MGDRERTFEKCAFHPYLRDWDITKSLCNSFTEGVSWLIPVCCDSQTVLMQLLVKEACSCLDPWFYPHAMSPMLILHLKIQDSPFTQ